MADSDDTLVFNVQMNWEDFQADPLKALRQYADQISAAMGRSGATAEQAFAKVRASLQQLREEGRITEQQFQKVFGEQVDANPNFDKWQKTAYKWGARLSVPQGQKEFNKQWDEAAMAVVRFGASFAALTRPFKQVDRFVEQLRKANLQFALLSQRALTSASDLAGGGGAFAALGGSVASYANFRNSFAMEMEKRRIGLGNGGQFTQALMHYGINYDPRSFDRTMQNIVSFMSSGSKTDEQKLMAGRMLGMDDAMIAAAKRGNAFYNEYQKTIKSMSSHQDEAAKRSQELSLETYKLFTAFQDLKNALFTGLEPIVRTIVKTLTPIVELLNTSVGRGLIYFVGAVLGTVTVMGSLRYAVGTLRILLGKSAMMILGWASTFSKMFAGGVAAKTAGSLLSTVPLSSNAGGAVNIPAPTTTWNEAVKDVNKLGKSGGGFAAGAKSAASKAGGFAASAGRFGGALISGGLVGAITSVVQAFQMKWVVDSLTDVIRTITRWQVMWQRWAEAGTGKFNRDRNARRMKQLGIGEGFLDAMEVRAKQAKAEAVYQNLAVKSFRHSAPVASGVTVEHLELTVQTQAADPAAVAEKVHEVLVEEFKVIEYDKKGVGI